jgi:hypothetical protein
MLVAIDTSENSKIRRDCVAIGTGRPLAGRMSASCRNREIWVVVVCRRLPGGGGMAQRAVGGEARRRVVRICRRVVVLQMAP